MKIFLDSANSDAIKFYSPIIDGVTTNPSLIAKEQGSLGYHEMIREIAGLIKGPVSVEVISTDRDQMIQEAQDLASLAPNVVIKIPVRLEGIFVIHSLSNLGIRTNATLIFSLNQALLAAKAGASYLSIFVGRLDDIGQNGVDVVRDTVQVIRQYGFSSEVLAASIRHPQHVMEVAKVGSAIATIPPVILEQMTKHPLTDIGLATFMSDWKKGGKQV